MEQRPGLKGRAICSQKRWGFTVMCRSRPIFPSIMTLRTGGLQYYPQTIKKFEERIAAYEKDAALAERHKPQGVDFDGTLVSPKHSSQRLRLLSANTWRLSSSSNPQSTAHRIMLNTSASLYLMYPECRGSFITISFGTVSSIFITLPHHTMFCQLLVFL